MQWPTLGNWFLLGQDFEKIPTNFTGRAGVPLLDVIVVVRVLFGLGNNNELTMLSHNNNFDVINYNLLRRTSNVPRCDEQRRQVGFYDNKQE